MGGSIPFCAYTHNEFDKNANSAVYKQGSCYLSSFGDYRGLRFCASASVGALFIYVKEKYMCAIQIRKIYNAYCKKWVNPNKGEEAYEKNRCEKETFVAYDYCGYCERNTTYSRCIHSSTS